MALRLANDGHRVHLISRHGLRVHQFDSESGWLGPKKMERFQRVGDVERRRQIIRDARFAGSVPPDVKRALRRAFEREQIAWHQAKVEKAIVTKGAVELSLETGEKLNVQRVFLATGFESTRPGGDMLDALVASASLPCASCGYPIVDRDLRWHSRVQVTGPLAELELGPVSRNIAGARKAGDRIIAGLSHEARAT